MLLLLLLCLYECIFVVLICVVWLCFLGMRREMQRDINKRRICCGCMEARTRKCCTL